MVIHTEARSILRPDECHQLRSKLTVTKWLVVGPVPASHVFSSSTFFGCSPRDWPVGTGPASGFETASGGFHELKPKASTKSVAVPVAETAGSDSCDHFRESVQLPVQAE